MRIGMMADLYKPHISGVTNCIALSKHFFEEWGHEVYVFTFGDVDYEDDEINVIRSPGIPVMETGFHFNLAYSRIAKNLLRTMDIIHVHHPFISGPLALRYSRSESIPVVFTNHTRYDLYAQAYLPIIPGVISETALEAYLPSFCRACDLVVAPSAGLKQVLENLGVEARIDVVPNGVDLQPFLQNPAPVDRNQLGFHPDDVILIYTGRLGPEKNLPFLLRSFAGVVNAYDHVGLVLVGDGSEKDNLVDRVKPGLVLDLHEGQGSKFQLWTTPFEEGGLKGVLASAMTRAAAEQGAELYTHAELSKRLPQEAAKQLWEPVPGLVVGAVHNVRQGMSFEAYCQRHGAAFSVVMGRWKGLAERVKPLLSASLASASSFASHYHV